LFGDKDDDLDRDLNHNEGSIVLLTGAGRGTPAAPELCASCLSWLGALSLLPAIVIRANPRVKKNR